MYVVRRHSRKLFFPAGLLALAWLLCLGCALLAARPELRPRYVTQLVLPRIDPPDSSAAENGLRQPIEWLHTSPQLNTLVPWLSVRITGNPWQDYYAIHAAELMAAQLVQFPKQNLGLRVEFGPHAHYYSLVQLLDVCALTKLQKYWLDFRHNPVRLYAFTKQKPLDDLEIDSNLLFIDNIGRRAVINLPLPPETWLVRTRQNWHWLTNSTIRRYSTFLLLLLPLAAAWQLRRLAVANLRR